VSSAFERAVPERKALNREIHSRRARKWAETVRKDIVLQDDHPAARCATQQRSASRSASDKRRARDKFVSVLANRNGSQGGDSGMGTNSAFPSMIPPVTSFGGCKQRLARP